MGDLFFILLLLSITVFCIGLIKPAYVLRCISETDRNRKYVVTIFGPLILLTFILFGITLESP